MKDLRMRFRVAELDETIPVLDLHGHSVEGARQEIDYFLSALVKDRIQIGKIIHGKGTERLMREIPRILECHRFVEAIHRPLGTYETGAVIYVSVEV